MAQLMEYAEYLSKEIGPRPAGTEEEQQAALYITERFQKDSGYTAQIEEFTSTSNIEGISALPGLVVIVVAVLGMIFPVLAIPAFILAAASAALYTLEAFGKPIVSQALARGASQNVVAKYQPAPEAGASPHSRSRKIILVANYDSGKVTPPLVRAVESVKLPVPIGIICVVGIILAAFLLLIHVFANTGMGAIVVNVLTVIALVICAYPVLRAILIRVAPYNEGANSNATGAAALLEVARRISRGSVSEADLANDPAAAGVSIHGEEAARESGLVPEGTQIRYEAERLVPPSELGEYDDEERLLAAKAAIAALTGQPVERRTFGTVATHLVNSRAHGDDPALVAPADPQQADAPAPAPEPAAVQAAASPASSVEASGQAAFQQQGGMQFGASTVAQIQPQAMSAQPEWPVVPVMDEPSPSADGYDNAPSWFVAAQKNAKKPASDAGPVQRSRYAEAIEAVEREAAERERERQERERLQREAELKEREKAAQEALAQSMKAVETSQSEAAPAGQETQALSAVDSSAPAQDMSATAERPVFVPYAEAHREDAALAKGAPAKDEFSASLGETAAFSPVLPASDDPAAAQSLQESERTASPQAPKQADGQAFEQADARLHALPEVDGKAQAPAAGEAASPSRSGMFRKLRADVPSMSGVIRMQAAGQDVSQPPVQQVVPARPRVNVPDPASIPEASAAAAPSRRPSPAAEPAAFAPSVADNGVDYDMDPSDIGAYGQDEYVGDDYDEGRWDEPGQVDMPKSRAGGFLGRFRRKKENLEETPQEWLDVDADFDARTVGRERGGWESFRDGYEDYDDYEGDDNGAAEDGRNRRNRRRWEGGAFSRVRLGRVDTRSGGDMESENPIEPVEVEDDHQIAEEIEQIYHFRNPLYNTEVWFAALGSEGASHGGAKAFIAEHGDELRGSMIIEVESLGAGKLSIASAEGRIKRIAASSRSKRYMSDASAATGIHPGSVDLTGSDSASSVFQAAGYQAMHLLGVENGAPALKGSPDDVLENVDDLLFDDNVNFIMELLKK